MKLFDDVVINYMNFADEYADYMDYHPSYGKVGTWHISFKTKKEDIPYKSDPFIELKDWINQEMIGPYNILDSAEMGGDNTVMHLSFFDFKDASLFYHKFEFQHSLHWVIHMLMQTFEWFKYEIPYAGDAMAVKNWASKNARLTSVGVVDGKLYIISIDKPDTEKLDKLFSLVKGLFVMNTDESSEHKDRYPYFVSMAWEDYRNDLVKGACTELWGDDRSKWCEVKSEDGSLEYYFSSVENIKEAMAYASLTKGSELLVA